MGLSVRTIVLAVVVIGLAVWIFGIDLPQERETLREQEEAARLLPIDPAVVDTLRVEQYERGWTVVRRDDGWWLVEPLVERAEDRTVESMIERLVRARSQRTMVPDLEDASWADYGLGPSSPGRVDLTLAGDDARAVLSVGNPIVAGDFCYVRREGSEALELALQSIFDLANASHQGMRRVDLFEIAEGDVVSLEIDGPGGAFAAVKDTTTGLWYPDHVGNTPRYRRWVLDDLALAVSEQRVQAFLRDDLAPGDWAAYGLDDPWARVTVTSRDGREQTLLLGNEREQDQFFARKLGLDTVIVVRPQFVPALEAGTIGLEDTNPIPANLRQAIAFRIEDDQGRWAELRPAGMDWVLVKDDGPVESSSYRQTAADNVARGLEEMQPERSLFLPSGGDPGALLDERTARVDIRFERDAFTLHFGWRDGERDPWFYVEGDASLYEVERGMILRLHSFVDAVHADETP